MLETDYKDNKSLTADSVKVVSEVLVDLRRCSYYGSRQHT